MTRKYPFNESDRLKLDPTYQELRRTCPVSRVVLPFGGEAWLAVRHADVRTVLQDPRFSRAAVVGREIPRIRPEVEDNPNSIMNMDSPDHTRLRKLLAVPTGSPSLTSPIWITDPIEDQHISASDGTTVQ